MQTATKTIYTVVPGDTLSSIARAHNTTIENIQKFNRIRNLNLIYIGQKLEIPLSPPGSIIYTVRSGDTLNRIARNYATSAENLVEFNYLSEPYTIYPGQQLIVL
jgi:LysM repeat protein